MLEKRLKQLNMTKKDLADALKVTPEAVYRWTGIPGYAEAYLSEKEAIEKLKENIRRIIE